MKKTLVIIAATTLLTNTTVATLSAINDENIHQPNDSAVISKSLAHQYAQETSIIPKSLLIGKNYGFGTDSLLTNLNGKLDKRIIHFNMANDNSGNGFINSLTTNQLDLNTINNIQSRFEDIGANQHLVDDANKKIQKYSNYKTYSSYGYANEYLSNKKLSDPVINSTLDTVLRSAKKFYPDITKYLSYVKYEKLLTLTSNELLTDWDQQLAWGNNPMEAMTNYIASEKGDITEAKTAGSKGQWYYVKTRATNWNWNDFYQYMAGANLNYMIKMLSGGKYIGDMITDNIYTSKFWFDKDTFMKELTDAIDKLPDNPKAWPYLIKALVPIIKIKILKFQDPTLGVKDLTWDNTLSNGNNDNKALELKTILLQIEHLLSPAGKEDLTNLIASLLAGPFGEDITFNVTFLLSHLWFTLPEVFEDASKEPLSWIASTLQAKTIAQGMVDQITKVTDHMNIPTLVNKVITFTDKYLTKNPQIDLRDLSTYLNNIFNDNFDQALNELVDIVNNPDTSKYNATGILSLLGVQPGQDSFKTNSSLYWLQNWLNEPTSSINQVLGILTSTDNTGIIDNMIKEQQHLLNKEYYDYFDINNQTKFKISHIITNEKQGVITLAYTLTDVVNKKDYSLVFRSNDKDHKIFLLHRFE